ncbi:MAG: hypothetical protein PVI43_00570 [Candidatus Bathyarchaeota archaeon]|jgi:hypothetical protein
MSHWIDKYRDFNNPYWPLPLDYSELSLDGQRQARLGVLTRRKTFLDFVVGWYFFRNVYLKGDKETYFYKEGQLESPDFHYDMEWDIAKFAKNAYAAPRGSAKSTVITVENTLYMSLCDAPIDIGLYFSTDKQKDPRFDTFMSQLTNNKLIIDDFGIQKPKRGTATWNHSYLQLLNGSTISGSSVMGKVRGGRPRFLVLDDPENDPDSPSETARQILMEKFETILFKKLIPMLNPGSMMFWIGTLIDRKSALYRAVQGDDPRFDYWNRKVIRAIAYDPDDKSKFTLLWPEKWSKDYLDEQKGVIGASAFASEYCNEPISEQDRILKVDERKNEYTVEGDFDWTNPLANTNKVKWCERVFGDENDHRTYEEKEKPFNELVGPMFKFLLFDKAHGLTNNHDYSCIAICGIDTLATLWVLHLWLGRAKDDTLMRLIYEYGLAWQVRILGIESVSIQKTFAEALTEYMLEQGDIRNDKWRGRVFPITYPAKESKADRIASSEWRFNSGRIKYPAHLQDKWPYNQLYAQTADFTLDLALLQHDDAIDTILGMPKYVIKTKGGRFKRERGKDTIEEKIKRGEQFHNGLPILSGIPLNKITDEMTNIMAHKARERQKRPDNRRLERRNIRIVRP